MLTNEKTLNEAIDRMYLLGLPPWVVYNLKYFNVRTVSMSGGNVEDMPEEYQILIDKFERDTGSYVYHVLVDEYKNKRFLYLLCVFFDEIDNKGYLETAKELISDPSSFKQKLPVLVAQRIDLCGHTVKYHEEPVAIKVIAELNRALKYAGLAKVPKFKVLVL